MDYLERHTAPVVVATDLHFSYGQHAVLAGVDLELFHGDIVVLLGPNGVGKTTLVENLVGTLVPNRGTVSVLGCNPARPSADFWGRVALIQQNWNDHLKWTVRAQLAWQRELHLSAGRPALSVEQVLANVGLSDVAHQTLGRLSGGQRRRIDFAAAQLGQPELYILDEPTTGLDPVARAQVHDHIAAAADAGSAVLMTTHDLAEAEKLASTIAILNDGQIRAQGSVDELRAHLVGKAQVTWQQDGRTHVHATSEVEEFIKTLDMDAISGLTITRPNLEDAYMDLVGNGAAQ